MMAIFAGALVLIAIFIAVYWFMQLAKFGKPPEGSRLMAIQQSPNYKNGGFKNQSITPDFTDGGNYFNVTANFLWGKSKRTVPKTALPNKKTNLLALAAQDEVLIWLGHSSYFLQLAGKTILVDPVLSGNASPLPGSIMSFAGSDIYTAEDFPAIDFLLISHDHWDHLDHKTLLQLKPKIGQIITGLGTGAHLERWGFAADVIHEKDWDGHISLGNGIDIYTCAARHFSGRGLKRNQAIWLSFVLKTPRLSLYLGGDSGFDSHFAEIGSKYGPFDLAILECGQYNRYWKHIHMTPEEVVSAAMDLKARQLLPVHWAKFALALHDWDEPIKRVTAAAEAQHLPVLHPMIGEALWLKSANAFPKWWEDLA